MGQQLLGRPISQRMGFGTLNTPSSSASPDQSQYLGFTTPPPAATASIGGGQMTQPPGIIGGFRGYPGIARGFGSSVGFIGRQMQS